MIEQVKGIRPTTLEKRKPHLREYHKHNLIEDSLNDE